MSHGTAIKDAVEDKKVHEAFRTPRQSHQCDEKEQDSATEGEYELDSTTIECEYPSHESSADEIVSDLSKISTPSSSSGYWSTPQSTSNLKRKSDATYEKDSLEQTSNKRKKVSFDSRT